MAYISAEMVSRRYPVSIDFQDEYNFVIIDFHREPRRIYEVAEAYDEEVEEVEPDEEAADDFIPLRFGPSDQEPIMARLWPGDEVVNLGHAAEGHRRVRLQNGLMGYVAAENLAFAQSIPGVVQIEPRRPITRRLDAPINLAYHSINVGNPAEWYAPAGVNVIAPKWFTFNEETRNGDIVSLANHGYMQWARANGLEVWAAITDSFFGRNFSNEVARLVLLDAEIRDHVIAQLLKLAATYNLDGININYEAVWAPEAEHWVQFLRELAVPMRQAGFILSVTTKPPMGHNMFWNRAEIGAASDYIVIMAYDEHWSTSPVAGPVASFNFVADAVRNTMLEVPPYQIVVALPTYVNIWREEFVDGEWQLVFNLRGETPRQVGMAHARSFVETRGGEFVWDYHVRQYYGQALLVEDGVEVRYRVWLEDLRSMDEKLGLVRQYNLAGVGFWQKGLELPAMWQLVYGHLN